MYQAVNVKKERNKEIKNCTYHLYLKAVSKQSLLVKFNQKHAIGHTCAVTCVFRHFYWHCINMQKQVNYILYHWSLTYKHWHQSSKSTSSLLWKKMFYNRILYLLIEIQVLPKAKCFLRCQCCAIYFMHHFFFFFLHFILSYIYRWLHQ